MEAEDEMVEWHRWLNGHEFGLTLEVGERQGGLVCCDSWGHKESDMAEQLNWTDEEQEVRVAGDGWQALILIG